MLLCSKHAVLFVLFLSNKNACLCGVVDGKFRVAKLPSS